MSKILKSIFALLLSFGSLSSAFAQQGKGTTNNAPKGVQYHNTKLEATAQKLSNRSMPTFAGLSLGFDLAGAALGAFSSSGSYEITARTSLRNRYFPTLEIGLGHARQYNEDTQNHFQTHSPYFRLGLDYNINKNLRNHNRVFFGLRYGFSPFTYDAWGKDISVEAWNSTLPFSENALRGQQHWGEALFGLEAEIWKFIHLAWSVRYRLRLHETQSSLGHAWYVPGYGNNQDHSTWGASFKVLVDLNTFAAHPKQQPKLSEAPPAQP